MKCGTLEGKLAQMNLRLLEVNDAVTAANVNQTKRCQRLAAGVRLLEEVLTEASPADQVETGEAVFVVPAEVMERVCVWLADYHAAEADGVAACAETGRG